MTATTDDLRARELEQLALAVRAAFERLDRDPAAERET